MRKISVQYKKNHNQIIQKVKKMWENYKINKIGRLIWRKAEDAIKIQQLIQSSQINYINFEMNERGDKISQDSPLFAVVDEQSNNHSYELYDYSRRSFNSLLREDSLPMRASLNVELSRQFANEDIDNMEGLNTINFWDASRNGIFQHGNTAIPEKPPQQAEEIQEPELDRGKKKGLKYLSWILNRLLRQRRFESNEVVNACIETVLSKQSEDYRRESQNVRRRIYDAINVMNAIGLTYKNSASEICIRVPEKSNPVCSNQIKRIVNRDLEMVQSQITLQDYKKLVEERLETIRNKRAHLRKLQHNLPKLRHHIIRNINSQRKLPPTTGPSEPDKDKSKDDLIRFPFLMIDTFDEGQFRVVCYGKQTKKIKIHHKVDDLVMFTQFHAMEYLYTDAEMEGYVVERPKIQPKKPQRVLLEPISIQQIQNEIKLEPIMQTESREVKPPPCNFGEIDMDYFQTGKKDPINNVEEPLNKRPQKFVINTIIEQQPPRMRTLPKLKPTPSRSQSKPPKKQEQRQMRGGGGLEQMKDQREDDGGRMQGLQNRKVKSELAIWLDKLFLRGPFQKVPKPDSQSLKQPAEGESYSSNSNY